MARLALLIVLFGAVFGFALWGLSQSERTVAMKWTLRVVLCLIFGAALAAGMNLLEGLE